MPFIIEDEEIEESSPEVQQKQTKAPSQKPFLGGYPKAAAKLAAIPVARTIENVGGALGGLIEAPAGLANMAYGFLGQEGPEWAQGPSPLRLNEQGQVIIPTPSDVRERRLLGEYQEPTNVIERELSDISDISSNLAISGVTNPRTLAAATTAAYGTRKGSELLGVSPPLATALEMMTTGAATAFGGKNINALEQASTKGKELAQTAKSEKVTQAPAAILKAGEHGGTTGLLKSFAKAGSKVREQGEKFVGQIQDAYHAVLGDIYHPFKTEKNLEMLQKTAGELFNPVRKLAAQRKGNVNIDPLIRAMQDNIKDIRKSKSLTPSQKNSVSILEDTMKRINSEGMTLEGAERTFRSFQDHIKNWDSLSKGDKNLINVQKAIKNEMLARGNSIPGFVDAFNFSNAAYSQLQNLKGVVHELSKIFDESGNFDLKRFRNAVFKPENESSLINFMGKQQYDRIRKIAELGEEGRKHFQKIGAILPESMQATHNMLGKSMGLGPTGFTNVLSEKLGQNFASKLLSNPNLQQNYLGYLTSLKRESPKVAAYYLRQIKKDLPQIEEGENEEYIIE